MKKSSRILIYSLIIMGFVLILASSCDKEKTVPVLATTAVSNITTTSASCGGNITGGCKLVSVRGVCWSITANPTTADSKTSDGTGQGSFTSTITGLSPNTTYYVRAYATNCVGTGYGSDISFTTQQ